MKYFIGREIEGSKNIGVSTLFIGPEDPSEEAVVSRIIRWLEQNNVDRIYFGAGNYRKLPSWINCFLDNCPRNINIIAEIDDINEIFKVSRYYRCRIEFVLFLDVSEIQSVKTVQDKKLTWIDLQTNTLSTNNINDIIYNEDREVLL